MSGPVLVAKRLSRWYGDVVGLNDVSVQIGAGITGLLGPNGAGKSSFLRIAAGEIRPSSGTLEVLGELPFANPAVHGRMGYCPEGDRFFGDLTAADFVTHLLRIGGYPKTEAADRAAAALAELGMASAAGVKLGACSKGMRQRIKLAQAVAHDPELLLLDEPLSGLDPLARHETQDLLRRRAEGGTTILVSSHVLHEVESLTNRVILINRGRVVATGEVAEIRALMDRYPHRIRLETPDARRLAALLVDRPDLTGLKFDDDALWVETARPDSFYDDLPAILVDNALPVTGIKSPDDRLEALFALLVEGT